MKLKDPERGANVRRNLRRWWKRLLMMMAGWLLLTVGVCTGAMLYAHAQHLSARRTQSLATGCAGMMVLVLVMAWLVVLVIADRRKSQ